LPRPGLEPAVRAARLGFAGGVLVDPGDGGEGEVLDVEDGLVLPAFANGHDHGKIVSGPSYGAKDDALELWLPQVMTAPPVPTALVARLFFARAARSGVASSMVLHTLFPPERLRTDVLAIAAAATAVGVRAAIGIPLHDRQFLAYATAAEERVVLDQCGVAARDVSIIPREVPTTAEAMDLVDELAATVESELVTVQYGPLGPQWASDSLLSAVAEGSARSGRRIHMHLFETVRQREWADARFRGGLVRHLDALGLLSPRLSVAHGVWFRADELELLAERGVTISVNASSNLRLRSGVAPVKQMLRSGVRLAIGLDGSAFDDDADFLRELRVAQRLNAGHGLTTDFPTADLFRAATEGSAFAVHGGPSAWGLEPGRPADVVVLDRSTLSADSMEPYRDDADLVVLRGQAKHVSHLVVGGRLVVQDGVVVGVDEHLLRAELAEILRSETSAQVDRRRVFDVLAPALHEFYRSGAHRTRSEPSERRDR
jgi:cytosine/adenosine deaminase-related metal-dependent hydrolase